MNILNNINTQNLTKRRGRPSNASLGIPNNPSYVSKKEINQMKQLCQVKDADSKIESGIQPVDSSSSSSSDDEAERGLD